MPTSQKEGSKSDAKTLPNTGSHSSVALSMIGGMTLLSSLGLVGRRRKK
ncbi:TPA: LPXTG cell wall anchor domain-containing protein [Streptococcus suis]